MHQRTNPCGTPEYVYDMLGRLENTALANGVTSTYTYTEAGQLESIVHAKGEQELASYQYEYYDNGNRKQAVELVSGSGAATGPTVQVTVVDTSGAPLAGKNIYAFNGSTYTNYSRVTDAQGQASITLPEGTYRFRVDVDGTQFWSGAENHCEIGQCGSVEFSIPQPVLVSVTDSSGAPQAGLKVYAFNGSTYTNFSATTDANGQVSLRLPAGNYRFRADFNGTQFWSGPENHCSVPGCTMASVQVTVPVTVLVKDNLSTPKAGIKVYAFNGSTYTNFSANTNEDGLAIFTLPPGSYRFRADFNDTQFWSGAANHCDVPDCEGTSVTVTRPVQVTVTDTDGAPKSGLKVYAFNGTTYTNFSATTDVAGQVNFTLPQGNYRFRADLNGTQFWSNASNHCEVVSTSSTQEPGCENADVTVSIPLVVSIQDGNGNPQTGVKVYAFNGATYTNYNTTSNAAGNATFTLPLGNYRFRADFNGVQYWSAASNHCTIPGCNSLALIVGPQATATPTSVATQTPTPTVPAATGTPEATLTETSAPQASPTSFATETSQPETTETPTPVSWLPGGAKVFAVSRPQQNQTNQVIITVLDTNDAPKAG
ncbi:MAG: carboxypeptidase regulatory-like domain-containing protein, partial [Anaerolineales bacterium]|nr:carboxypeptidase regulatory-like domain-containing protein [Anaerolineales bacterium]